MALNAASNQETWALAFWSRLAVHSHACRCVLHGCLVEPSGDLGCRYVLGDVADHTSRYRVRIGFFRGYLRAFFIGTTVTLFIYANATIHETDSVLELLTSAPISEDLLSRSPSSMYFLGATEFIARRTVLVIGVSLLSGLMAVTCCWLAQNTKFDH